MNKKTRNIIKQKRLCPVCRRHHFKEFNAYEICPICGWEDDPVQRRDPYFEGGANKMSLNMAIKDFNEKDN